MTPFQIIKALMECQEIANEPPERFPADGVPPDDFVTTMRHVSWMCSQARQFVEFDPSKAERWLMFIQGVMWSQGQVTIEDIMKMNAP